MEWVKAYPHLGTISLAFMQQPSVDFQLHLVMGSSESPDVMDLAPPLREWLSKLVRDTITAYISISHPYRIPLFEWYGEELSAEAAAAAAAAAAKAKAAASDAFAFRRPPATDAKAAPPRQAAVRPEAARPVSQRTRRAAAPPAETAEAAGALPLELSRQIRALSHGEAGHAEAPATLREHAFRPPSPLHQPRTSDPSPRPLPRPRPQRPPPQWPSQPAARLGSDEAAALPPITTSAEFFGSCAPGSPAAPRARGPGCAHGVASSLGGSNVSLASSLEPGLELDGRLTPPLVSNSPRRDSPRALRMQATRAMELHSGAVGELVVRVHDVVNVVSEGTARLGSGLAPHVFVCASVGDGEEQRSQPASTSGGQVGRLGVVTPLRSDFRMCVHDNVTQRLRLRVVIKEFSDKVSKEPYEVGSAEVGFAALGFGGSENHTLALQAPVEQMPTQWLRLQLTYVSHA